MASDLCYFNRFILRDGADSEFVVWLLPCCLILLVSEAARLWLIDSVAVMAAKFVEEFIRSRFPTFG